MDRQGKKNGPDTARGENGLIHLLFNLWIRGSVSGIFLPKQRRYQNPVPSLIYDDA